MLLDELQGEAEWMASSPEGLKSLLIAVITTLEERQVVLSDEEKIERYKKSLVRYVNAKIALARIHKTIDTGLWPERSADELYSLKQRVLDLKQVVITTEYDLPAYVNKKELRVKTTHMLSTDRFFFIADRDSKDPAKYDYGWVTELGQHPHPVISVNGNVNGDDNEIQEKEDPRIRV